MPMNDMKITLSYNDYDVLRNGYRQAAELKERIAELEKVNAEMTTRQYDNRGALVKAQETLTLAEQSMRRKDTELMQLRRRCEVLETQRRSDDREIDVLKNDKGKDRATLEKLGRELHEIKQHYATVFVFLAKKLDTDGNDPGLAMMGGKLVKLKPSAFCLEHAKELSPEAKLKAEQQLKDEATAQSIQKMMSQQDGRSLLQHKLDSIYGDSLGVLTRDVDSLPVHPQLAHARFPFAVSKPAAKKGCPAQRDGKGCVVDGAHDLHESAEYVNGKGLRCKLVWI